MDDDIKTLLKKNLEASEESLKLLRKIHRDVWWRRLWGIVKFGVVVGLLVLSYLKLEPLLAGLLDTYQSILKTPAGQSFNVDTKTLPPSLRSLIEGLLKTN